MPRIFVVISVLCISVKNWYLHLLYNCVVVKHIWRFTWNPENNWKYLKKYVILIDVLQCFKGLLRLSNDPGKDHHASLLRSSLSLWQTNDTALMAASEYGHISIVKLLLGLDADVNLVGDVSHALSMLWQFHYGQSNHLCFPHLSSLLHIYSLFFSIVYVALKNKLLVFSSLDTVFVVCE